MHFCIPDCVNRIINVYDQNNYVVQTSVHITKDDVINSIEISEESGDLYTAISVLGDEELNIAPVNPLGANVIYNFDYYIPWMSAELQDRINAWKALVAESTEDYYDANLAYYTLLTSQSNKQANLNKLDVQLTMYRRCRDNIVAESSTDQVEGFNKVIVDNGGTPIEIAEDIAETIAAIDDLIALAEDEYTNTQTDLTEIENQLSELRATITSIRNSVNIEQFFVDTTERVVIVDGNETTTEDRDTHLLDELTNYIYEGAYTDEYIAVTDTMTYSEKFSQMKRSMIALWQDLKEYHSRRKSSPLMWRTLFLLRTFSSSASSLKPDVLSMWSWTMAISRPCFFQQSL